MSKAAEKNNSYLSRINQDSTKPFKTGDNEHLATQHFDVDYSTEKVAEKLKQIRKLDNEIDTEKSNLAGIEERLIKAKTSSYVAPNKKAYQDAQALIRQLGLNKLQAQNNLSKLKRIRSGFGQQARAKNFERIFIEIAKESLPQDLYKRIHNQAHIVLLASEESEVA